MKVLSWASSAVHTTGSLLAWASVFIWKNNIVAVIMTMHPAKTDQPGWHPHEETFAPLFRSVFSKLSQSRNRSELRDSLFLTYSWYLALENELCLRVAL